MINVSIGNITSTQKVLGDHFTIEGNTVTLQEEAFEQIMEFLMLDEDIQLLNLKLHPIQTIHIDDHLLDDALSAEAMLTRAWTNSKKMIARAMEIHSLGSWIVGCIREAGLGAEIVIRRVEEVKYAAQSN